MGAALTFTQLLVPPDFDEGGIVAWLGLGQARQGLWRGPAFHEL